jgi:hypothetical protein
LHSGGFLKQKKVTTLHTLPLFHPGHASQIHIAKTYRIPEVVLNADSIIFPINQFHKKKKHTTPITFWETSSASDMRPFIERLPALTHSAYPFSRNYIFNLLSDNPNEYLCILFCQ